MERQWFVDEAAVDEHEEAGELAQRTLPAMGALSGCTWSAGGAMERSLPAALRRALVVAAPPAATDSPSQGSR